MSIEYILLFMGLHIFEKVDCKTDGRNEVTS